jgi:hypothetical protein
VTVPTRATNSSVPATSTATAVAPEPSPRDTHRMGAAIVLGDDLDILMAVVPVQFVLDAEVGKVDTVVEVRQVVFVRPAFDFARVAIGSSIAFWSAAIVLL